MADNLLTYKTGFIIRGVLHVMLFADFVGLVNNKIINKENGIKTATPVKANKNV